MLKVSLFLFPSCIAIVLGLRNECPPADSMSCSCQMRTGPTITCSRFETEDELKSSLEALKGYKVNQLTVSDVTVPAIIENLYEGLYVNQFILENVEVLEKPNAKRQYFSGLEKSLQIFEVTNSFKKEFPLEHLRLDYLSRLKAILMKDNKILEIGNDWFESGPIGLRILTLERNGIESLGDKAFHSLQNLQNLWLIGNSFSTVERSMFPMPAPKLEKIDLSNNKIKEIPANLFSDMPALYSVFIRNNQIQTISQDTFSSHNLQYLRLDGNPLKCDAELNWVCNTKANLRVARCDSPRHRSGIALFTFCELKIKS